MSSIKVLATLFVISCGVMIPTYGESRICKAIDVRATDSWCNNNCNHNPSYCPPGFCKCGEDIDECLPGPCKNGGTCHDQVNGFTCDCPAGYTGADCNTGSTVKFEASQTEVHAHLTPSLVLTCNVTAAVTSPSPGNDPVTQQPYPSDGMATQQPSPSNEWATQQPSSGMLIGRSVRQTQGDSDMAFLTSIVVRRNGVDHVASITEHTAATALVDLDNLKVEGQMSGASGHMTLTWRHPRETEVGGFTCEANGLTSQGHKTQLTDSLEVTTTTPQVSDLVRYIAEQQKTIDRIEEKESNGSLCCDKQADETQGFGSLCGQRPLFLNNGAYELDGNPANDGRIVGGNQSVPFSWPSICGLYNRYGYFECGGTLVKNSREEFVFITAAHCLSSVPATYYRVYCGMHIKARAGASGDNPSHLQILSIVSVKEHENFDWDTFENDIAVMKFSTQPVENKYVQAACLPDTDNYGDEKSIVAGWGAIKPFPNLQADRLMQVNVPIKSDEFCLQRLGEWYNSDNMMCAGTLGRDYCQGDSGGPLYTLRNNLWTLTGVVSFGYDCGEIRPGVYADVYQLRAWIDKNIN